METKEVAARYFAALERNDLDGVIATLDPACRAEVPGTVFDSREEVRAWMKSFFDAFPDIRHSIGELEVDGQRAAVDVHVDGTQTEPLVTPQGTIPATGKPIDFTARNEMEIASDAVARLRIDFDAAGFMRQLGVG